MKKDLFREMKKLNYTETTGVFMVPEATRVGHLFGTTVRREWWQSGEYFVVNREIEKVYSFPVFANGHERNIDRFFETEEKALIYVAALTHCQEEINSQEFKNRLENDFPSLKEYICGLTYYIGFLKNEDEKEAQK